MEVVASLVILGLAVLISEPVFILFGLMRTSEQETLERHHVKTKGAQKRYQQLRTYAVATVAVMAILLIMAYKCWQIWTAPLDFTLAEYPRDPSDGWAVAAVGLAIVAALCLPWLMILRAKLKAVRALGQDLK